MTKNRRLLRGGHSGWILAYNPAYAYECITASKLPAAGRFAVERRTPAVRQLFFMTAQGTRKGEDGAFETLPSRTRGGTPVPQHNPDEHDARGREAARPAVHGPGPAGGLPFYHRHRQPCAPGIHEIRHGHRDSPAGQERLGVLPPGGRAAGSPVDPR